MNPIIALLKKHHVNDEKIKDIFQSLTENPLMAMATISQLNIPPEELQPVMFAAMQNPQLIKDAVEELGLDFSKVEAAKEQLAQGE